MVTVITIPIVGIDGADPDAERRCPVIRRRARHRSTWCNIVPQVRGRVIEVPVEPNRPVKKGAVLFRMRSDAV